MSVYWPVRLLYGLTVEKKLTIDNNTAILLIN